MRRAQRLAREAADEVERAAGGTPQWTRAAILHLEDMRRLDRPATVVADWDDLDAPWVIVCRQHGEAARAAEWGEIMRRHYAHLRVWHGRTS